MYFENTRGEKRAMSFVGHEGGRGSGIESIPSQVYNIICDRMYMS